VIKEETHAMDDSSREPFDPTTFASRGIGRRTFLRGSAGVGLGLVVERLSPLGLEPAGMVRARSAATPPFALDQPARRRLHLRIFALPLLQRGLSRYVLAAT